MPSQAEQVRSLLARAARLERDLALVILELDDDAVMRLAQVALEIGFTREEIEAVFAANITRHLDTLYDIFGTESATEASLPVATAAVQHEAEVATTALLSNLTDEANAVVARLVAHAKAKDWSASMLANALQKEIALTEAQNGYVANFARKLRIDHRLAFDNALRDRSFDRRLNRADPLDDAEIAKMTDAYRRRWLKHRATTIAQHVLHQAANATSLATYIGARDILPDARKFWVHMHDGRVRDSHLEIPGMNEGGVPLDAAFATPLGPLRFPLDPEGDPANVIGCRCILTFNVQLP